MNKLQPLSQLTVVMIDNFDSFTYNLVNQIRVLGARVIIYRNDVGLHIIKEAIENIEHNVALVFSPGPGKPSDVPLMKRLLKRYIGIVPILGICLGHQAIIEFKGGKITQARKTVHGKSDRVYLTDNELSKEIFSDKFIQFQAARYHSLVAKELPESLSLLAETRDSDNEIMAIASRNEMLLGFQFHPESILTNQGRQIILTSLNWLCQISQLKTNHSIENK